MELRTNCDGGVEAASLNEENTTSSAFTPQGRGEGKYIPSFAAPAPRRQTISYAHEAKEPRKNEAGTLVPED